MPWRSRYSGPDISIWQKPAISLGAYTIAPEKRRNVNRPCLSQGPSVDLLASFYGRSQTYVAACVMLRVADGSWRSKPRARSALRIACLCVSTVVAGCGGTEATTSGRPQHRDESFLTTAPAVVDTSSTTVDAGVSAGDMAAINTYLNSFYTDAAVQYSFTSVNGETIACLGIADAGGPPIPPPSLFSVPSGGNPASVTSKAAFDGSLDANGHVRRCPAGTVAELRPTVDEILNAGGLSAYLAAQRPPFTHTQQNDCWTHLTAEAGYDHAAAYANNLSAAGSLTFTTVQLPNVNPNNEHSLSEIWSQTGTCESAPDNSYNCTTGASGNAVQSLEVGWISGQDTGDCYPRLFAFITLDGYNVLNCYAHNAPLDQACCPNPNTSIGQDTSCWIPISNPYFTMNMRLDPQCTCSGSDSCGSCPSCLPTGQAPSEVAFQVWNGTAAGYPYWYVWVDGTLMGAYPASIFAGTMQTGITYMQAGGEVFDSWPSNQHTLTQMGSGIAPAAETGHGYKYAAYHRNIQYLDSSGNYHTPSLSYIVDSYSPDEDFSMPGICGYEAGLFYSLSSSLAAGGSSWGNYFYYGGGPGNY